MTMSQPILWSFRRCPYAMRARLAIQSSGVAVHLREILLRDKPPEFIADSAKATVPVLKLPHGEVIEESLDVMRWALAQNDPDGQLKVALESSGYGSHPAVLNFLVRLGESMKEGGFLKSAVNRPPGKKTAAQTIFSNHPSAED